MFTTFQINSQAQSSKHSLSKYTHNMNKQIILNNNATLLCESVNWFALFFQGIPFLKKVQY